MSKKSSSGKMSHSTHKPPVKHFDAAMAHSNKITERRKERRTTHPLTARAEELGRRINRVLYNASKSVSTVTGPVAKYLRGSKGGTRRKRGTRRRGKRGTRRRGTRRRSH
jgi:hypothetical protein